VDHQILGGLHFDLNTLLEDRDVLRGVDFEAGILRRGKDIS